MIGRLAKENAQLLRHLLVVLHAVQANAEENQMTSFNLSVCIAPSLLWPPGAPCSPEVEGRGAKKVRSGFYMRIWTNDAASLACGAAVWRNFGFSLAEHLKLLNHSRLSKI